MHETLRSSRTTFYNQKLAGIETPEVESLRSYIQRLAAAHFIKPSAVIATLLRACPSATMKEDLGGRMQCFRLHGIGQAMQDLLHLIESGTGAELGPATMDRFGKVFSNTRLVRVDGGAYCPACVRDTDGEEIAHGRLLWELGFVTACPKHGGRLRPYRDCGAPAEQHLPLNRRPSLAGVCGTCGSIGYRCVGENERATPSEVWIAKQAGALLALPDSVVREFTPEGTRAGIKDLVDQVYGGRVVNAAIESHLARSSVLTWLKTDTLPSLGLLVKLCLFANADLVAIMQGRFQPASDTVEIECREIYPEIEKGPYTRIDHDWDDIRAAIVEATAQAYPPAATEMARRFQTSVRELYKKLPVELAALTKKGRDVQSEEYRQRYQEAHEKYAATAAQIADRGLKVSSKRLQQESGLVAFTKNPVRIRALNEVMAQYAPPS